jgi:hypothetical protein
MAKLQTMILIVVLIQAALVIYGTAPGGCPDGYEVTTDNRCCADYNSATEEWENCLDDEVDTTPLWQLFINPTGINWRSGKFILIFIGLAVALGFATISATPFIGGSRTDTQIFAPAVLGLIGMGYVVFVNLYSFLQRELVGGFFYEPGACEITKGVVECNVVSIILLMAMMPVVFIYIWTVVEWWRGKDI